jgi:hypothetical protein
MIRAGVSAEHKPDVNFSYSLDSGKTWQQICRTRGPGQSPGNVAISADGSTWTRSAAGSL